MNTYPKNRLAELEDKLSTYRARVVNLKQALDTCQASFLDDVKKELRFTNRRIVATLETISWSK